MRSLACTDECRWQQRKSSQGDEKESRERRGKIGLASGESDEDDEANIPVL